MRPTLRFLGFAVLFGVMPWPIFSQQFQIVRELNTQQEAMGLSGMFCLDVDDSGDHEMVYAGLKGIVIADITNGVWDMQWVKNFYWETVVSLSVYDQNGDGISELYVMLDNGSCHVFNGATKQLEQIIQTGTSPIVAKVANIDLDASGELVVTNNYKTYVYDLATGALEWQGNYPGKALMLGNIDNDPNLEIILNNDSGTTARGFVIDGETKAVQWEYYDGFGQVLALADGNSDGIDDIFGANPNFPVSVFSGIAEVKIKELAGTESTTAMAGADLDGNGISEILVGRGGWGNLRAFNAVSNTFLWSIDNPHYQINAICYEDLDDDGEKEVLWTVGDYSYDPDKLFAAEIAPPAIEFESQDYDDFVFADVVDAAFNGSPDYFVAHRTRCSGAEGGAVRQIDVATGNVVWEWLSDTRIDLATMMRSRSANTWELAVYSGYKIYIFELPSHTIIDSIDVLQSFTLEAADTDGDGLDELFIVQGVGQCSIVGYNGSTYETEWTKDFGGHVEASLLGNLDDDPALEILLHNQYQLYECYDGLTHDLQWAEYIDNTTLTSPIVDMESADLDLDGMPELLMATEYTLVIVDPSNLTVLEEVVVFEPYPINDIEVVNVDGTSRPEILFLDKRLRVLESENFNELWSTDFISVTGNRMKVRDLWNDNKVDILLRTYETVYHFGALTTDVQQPQRTGVDFDVVPNPVETGTLVRLNYHLPTTEEVRLDISDASGRLVAMLVQTEQTEGEQSVVWNTRDAAAGVYFSRLTVGGHTTVRKVVVH